MRALNPTRGATAVLRPVVDVVQHTVTPPLKCPVPGPRF